MADRATSRKPADTPFKQQRLKAWQPILTPRWVIFTFIAVGVIFIPIGIAVFVASQQIVEVSVDYTSCELGKVCDITFKIDKEMTGPIYAYYELTKFYQNHRRYVQSRSDIQLRGSFLNSASDPPMTTSDASSATSDCSPASSYEEGGRTLYYYPCGLVARSWFNDTFLLLSPSNVPFTNNSSPSWNDKTGLAWPSDIEKKFQQADDAWMRKNCYKIGSSNAADFPLSGFSPSLFNVSAPSGVFDCWHNVSDEKFIVWMRTAGLPDFKKLYARMEDGDLAPGTYTLRVRSVFPVTSFGGTKSFVLSTTRWIGGKNNFLGIAYLVVGSLCMLMGIIFLVKHLVSPRTLGDQQYLVWKQ